MGGLEDHMGLKPNVRPGRPLRLLAAIVGAPFFALVVALWTLIFFAAKIAEKWNDVRQGVRIFFTSADPELTADLFSAICIAFALVCTLLVLVVISSYS